MSEWRAGIINELTVADSFYVDHTMLGLGVDSAYAWRAEPPEDADRVPSWLAVPAAEVIEAYRHPRPDAALVRAGWERSTRADPLRLTVARSQGGVSRWIRKAQRGRRKAQRGGSNAQSGSAPSRPWGSATGSLWCQRLLVSFTARSTSVSAMRTGMPGLPPTLTRNFPRPGGSDSRPVWGPTTEAWTS